MGTLTAAQLGAEVLGGVGNRTDIVAGDETIALNLAQMRLARYYDFSELSQLYQFAFPFTNTPSADKFITLTTIAGAGAPIKDIHSIFLQDGANSRKLVEKPWRWFDKQFPLPEFDAPAWPGIYIRWGSTLTLWPSPQKAYVGFARTTVYPTTLDVAGSPNAFSSFDQKDDILIHWAVAYIFRKKGRRDLAMEWWQQGMLLAQEAIEKEDTRPDMDTTNSFPSDIPLSQYWANPFVQSVATMGA